MSDDSKLPVRDTAALALDVVTGGPLGSIVNAGFNLVGGFVGRGNAKRAQHAFEVLVDEWAAVGRMTPEEAEPEVRRLLTEGDPNADDQLHEAFRRMNSSTSGASWPYIARMTATYLQEGRATDAFFRRCGWLLERCGNSDIGILADLAEDSFVRREVCGYEGPLSWLSIIVSISRISVHVVTENDKSGVFFASAQDWRKWRQGLDLLRLLQESRLARTFPDEVDNQYQVRFDEDEGFGSSLLAILSLRC